MLSGVEHRLAIKVQRIGEHGAGLAGWPPGQKETMISAGLAASWIGILRRLPRDSSLGKPTDGAPPADWNIRHSAEGSNQNDRLCRRIRFADTHRVKVALRAHFVDGK
jgi:hypothetical protein